MNEIQLLRQEIAELKNWKKSLEASHSIPLNIDQAFRERFPSSANVSVTGVGTFSTQNVYISGTPATIAVPAQPSSTVKVTIGKVEYEFLIK